MPQAAWSTSRRPRHRCILPMRRAGKTQAQALAANRDAWLVLPPSLVSTTGNDCDLVGTSFAAFRNQVVQLSPERTISSFDTII